MEHLVLLVEGCANVQVLQDLARESMPSVRVTLMSPFVKFVSCGERRSIVW